MTLVDLPNEIKRAREEKELSKSKAAVELGVSRLTYAMWEQGAWVPQIDKTRDLATFTSLRKEEVLSYLARKAGMIDDNAYLETRYSTSE